MIGEKDREAFDHWLTEEVGRGLRGEAPEVPIVRWGREHTEVAVRYATYVLRQLRHGLPLGIQQALNEGDGTYHP